MSILENKKDHEKLINDPSYFAEKILGIKLHSYQKKILKAMNSDKPIIIIRARDNSRKFLEDIMKDYNEYKDRFIDDPCMNCGYLNCGGIC